LGEVSGLNIGAEYYSWEISPISGLRINSKYDDDGTTAPINRLIGRDIIALHGIETSASIWNEAAGMNEYPISAGPGIKIEDVDDVTVFSTSGVMMEADIGYNGQGEISGYNGSPIMTVDSEKQWLTHDDTIAHVTNSAQYAFGVNVPVVAQAMGTDETVIYAGSSTQITSNTDIDLTESFQNFEKIKVYIRCSAGASNAPTTRQTLEALVTSNEDVGLSPYAYSLGSGFDIDSAHLSFRVSAPTKCSVVTNGTRINVTSAGVFGTTASRGIVIQKIVGIGRKENT
jgi:hypothetical protein